MMCMRFRQQQQQQQQQQQILTTRTHFFFQLFVPIFIAFRSSVGCHVQESCLETNGTSRAHRERKIMNESLRIGNLYVKKKHKVYVVFIDKGKLISKR